MENALDLLNDPNLAISKYSTDDENLGLFTRSANWHPRLKLFTSSTGPVKRKKFPENHYGLIVNKDTTIDLGESFVAIPLAYRYKALDFSEKGKVKSYYDPKDPGFLACKKEADKKRPADEMSPCMAGMEFLLSINTPEKATLGTLLCSSASLKTVASKLFGMMQPTRKFVLFGSHLVDGRYVYQCPNVAVYSGSFDYGDVTKLKLEITQFANTAGSVTEEARPEEDDAPPPTDEARVR